MLLMTEAGEAHLRPHPLPNSWPRTLRPAQAPPKAPASKTPTPFGKARFGHEALGASLVEFMFPGFGETMSFLTVGVFAMWGSGKSFLMNKMETELACTINSNPMCSHTTNTA